VSTIKRSGVLDVRRIFHEADVPATERGRQVLARFPDAELVEVESHARIPELFGNAGQAERWMQNKRETLVVGTLKTPRVRDNGRSADFIAPSTANGCALACTYCYVPRHKGFANPITVFTNIEKIIATTERHLARTGPKTEPNQCDPRDWVYDLGENSDCSVDAMVSDNVRDLVDFFAVTPGAKGSFATKFVNPELLTWQPRGKTRVRFSLMPHDVSARLDLRTSRVRERIAAINDFVDAGYEVHLNFSPVVVFEGWLQGWIDLFAELDDVLSPAAKQQLACEIIFLTHNEALHEVNLGWHPQGEELVWTPDIQEQKVSQNGAVNVRYRARWKHTWVERLREALHERMPYCTVRYAF
jgi:spore photoproduct lyase